MNLVLIRHGVAEDPDAFAKTGEDDALRPLTKDGRRKMERAAAGLRRIVKSIDVLASSPYVRAMQTAQIVADSYDSLEIVTADALVPDEPFETFLDWLRHHRGATTVAAVGHEPHLSRLATWLLAGKAESHVAFGKGGACLLELSNHPRAGGATMHWLLTPDLLRHLGE